MSAAEDRINAGRAVVLRWLTDEVKEHIAGTRNVLEPRMEPGERIRAELPDGTVIGHVTIGNPSETPTVTDERALLAWVKANKPTEIVESVNPAYVEVLKRQAKAHGHAFDHDTGEVIPGIGLKESAPSYRPTPDKKQVPLLRARLSEVIAGGLLELPASNEREAS